ncbi:MAG TPA: transcriptional activator NhaR [Verrucomicrobiae bacterium]|nr:transcriptional activator NhaR [Verrucomicrobiae bacterium]
MEWLNYHHLYYFWAVVRTGSIAKACEELRLAPPTVSAQLHELENQLGEKLLERSGRGLIPTEMGRRVYRHADEIFSIGREIMDTVKHRPTQRPLRLSVGIDDVLPKIVAYRILEPALHLKSSVQLFCREASLGRLAAELAVHELDVVLSDAPVTPSVNLRVYSHRLGATGVVWMGVKPLVRLYARGFPKSLDGAPILLPTDDTAIRLRLDQWFASLGVRPRIVGEFEDYALLRSFGQGGVGLFPAPAVLETQYRREGKVQRVGVARGIENHFYAISAEEKVRHPAVIAIYENAARGVFGRSR